MGWLIALAIIFGITALFWLVLSVPIKLDLTVSDNNLSFLLRIGLFRISLFPASPRKIRLRDYEKARMEKRKKKKQKKKPAKKDSAAKKSEKKKEKKKYSFSDIGALLRFAIRVLKILLAKFGQSLRIDLRELQIVVATEDAAQTALLFGAVSPAAAWLLSLSETHKNFHIRRGAPLSCRADFLAQKSSLSLHILFTIRPRQILSIGFSVLRAFLADRHVTAILFHK